MVTLGEIGGTVLHVVFPPFIFIVSLTLILASIGKSLGIRKLYVKTLMRIFEFAGRVASEAQREQQSQERNRTFHIGESDDDSAAGGEASTPRQQSPLPQDIDDESTNSSSLTEEDVSFMRQKLKKMGKESRHNVISRKDNLILNPDRAPTIPGENHVGADAAAAGSEETAPNAHVENSSSQDNGTPLTDKILSGKEVSVTTFQREFELDDVLAYVKTGIASIIEDEVTQRFEAEELKSWNLLTRTSNTFEFVNVKLTVIWIVGFIFRYFILLPGRFLVLCVGLLWMAICMAAIGKLKDSPLKKKFYKYAYMTCFQVLGGSLSAVITYHCPGNKPKEGICVANHTSPIDVLILACDNVYDLIGQRHGGLLWYFQNVLSSCSNHIWFERSQAKDRLSVQMKLQEHVEDPDKLPILIFPEGTCINNTSVMQFKKGSFEVGGTIYPVAIKYDPLFGDAFWNSSKYGMMTYIMMMMTSWAIVCDVWYLPPMTKKEGEDAITFANRVKAEIARRGGLVDLMWDGNLKRASVKSEWKAIQQQAFSQRLKVE